ncbi:YfhO family protein [Lactococcus lactis]|uniref:YfhO family protein n=1 Tax=Lactococcus lactis TaxID=1358 RepID=UPI001652A24F|nr:YfhO family protein [Lactococcus lactis]QNL91230.1 YfhO family protein [Lactococcus lactis]
MKFIKKNKWALLASFFIPLLLMVIVLAMTGIYWGSSRSILAGDAYHQYVAIHSLYRNILHSGGSSGFLYTFTSGLGLNLYAFSAYYMGSFLMPLTFFFDVKSMPDALYLLTILKFGLIGLSAFVSFKNMYQNLSKLIVLSISIAFALMSFLTSQLEITMWLDVFILLPLIIWGLHRLMDERKRWLYFVSLLILFIQNYYFGFMVAIFLVLYFLARITYEKWSWTKVLDFVVSSALAGLSSLIMLLPMYLDLKSNNSDALSTLSGVFTENSHLFDLFAKNFVGTYDTTQFNAIPMIYVGMMPLALAILFFFTKSIRLRSKFAFLGIIAFFVASFYLQALDLLWQGMHSPNMFLHRYAFLFSLLLVLMALETLSRWEEIKTWHILTISLFLITGFLATLIFGHYKYVMTSQVMLTFLFGLAYLILSINSVRKWISAHLFVIILFVFMTVEAGVNALYQVQGIQKEWNFASRDYYNTQVNSIEPIANKVNELTGSGFARMDNTVPDTANDGMKYNFNALSQFSSVRNSNASSIMRQLGFHTDSTYLNLRYPGNTLLMDSIFGIKYNISQAQPPKFGFSPVSNALSNLSKNSNAMGLGVFVPNGFEDAKFTDKAQASSFINNQTALVNALTKSKTTFFTPFYTTSEETADKITGAGNSVTLTRPKTSTATDVSVTYGITVAANSQIYLSVPNITYLNSNAENTLITISDVSNPKMTRSLNSYYVGTNDTGSFLNLGSFSKETKLKVTLAFPENSQVTFDTTSFWRLDTEAYQKEMALLQSRSPKTEMIKNGVRMTYTEKEKGDIFLTIPYDKGWSAKVDGKKVAVSKAQSGFMKVSVPAGSHRLELKFFPNGLKEGIICFILGILLFIGYNYFTNKPKKSGGTKNES